MYGMYQHSEYIALDIVIEIALQQYRETAPTDV
jgi:hypothetical protein